MGLLRSEIKWILVPLRIMTFHRARPQKSAIAVALVLVAMATTIPQLLAVWQLGCAIGATKPLLYGTFFMNMVALIWNLQSVASYLFIVFILHSGKFDRFAALLEQNCSEFNCQSFKKHVLVTFACFVGYTVYGFVTTSLSAVGILQQGFMIEIYGVGILRYSGPFLTAWGSASWSLAVCFYYIVGQTLLLEANYLQRLIDVEFSRIGQISLRYVNLVETVRAADGMLKHYGAVMLSMSVLEMVLQLYACLLAEGVPTNTRIQILGWLVGQAWHIVMVSSVARIFLTVGEYPQSFYAKFVRRKEEVEDRSLSDSSRDCQEAAMLLHQFSVNLVGFTFWDLFVINQTTMSTMFSLVMTYFIIVIQFVNPNVGQLAEIGTNVTTGEHK